MAHQPSRLSRSRWAIGTLALATFSRCMLSHGPAMAYMSHGRADAESLLEFMDSRRRPTSEILVIFLGQPTSAEVGDASPTFL